jgi:hypothetical protein
MQSNWRWPTERFSPPSSTIASNFRGCEIVSDHLDVKKANFSKSLARNGLAHLTGDKVLEADALEGLPQLGVAGGVERVQIAPHRSHEQHRIYTRFVSNIGTPRKYLEE